MSISVLKPDIFLAWWYIFTFYFRYADDKGLLKSWLLRSC